MNKKGQFFLIAALITMFVVYTLVIEYNTVREYVALEDFEPLTENYLGEQSKVINKERSKGEEGNEAGALKNFTVEFLGYAGDKDPNFGILTFYEDSQGIIHIVNTLNNKVLNIETPEGTTTLLSFGMNTSGEVCIEGIGCNKVTTDVDKFGKGFYEQTFEGMEFLFISILNEDSSKLTSKFDVSLKEFKNPTYMESEKPLVIKEFKSKNVKVSCTGCPTTEI